MKQIISIILWTLLPLSFLSTAEAQQREDRSAQRPVGQQARQPRRAPGPLTLDVPFSRADKDNDGKARFEDFSEQRYFRRSLFDAIDSNRDGILTREEVAVAVKIEAGEGKPKRIQFEGNQWVADHAFLAEVVKYKGKQAMHIAGREQTYVYLPVEDFEDGIIEVDVASDIFCGIAFRGRDNGRRAEKLYFRPQVAGTDRHQNTVQYAVMGREDGHWRYLREKSPGKYETGADIKPGEWFHVLLEIKAETLKVFVNDKLEPIMIVKPMLDGKSKGSVGVWGWNAYFANFRYTQQEPSQVKATRHQFVLRSEVTAHEPANTVTRIMLTADQTDGRYSIVDEIFKPGMRSFFPHKHAKHSETFIILRGKMEWVVGGEKQTVGPGDMVYIPPHTPHSTRVVGDEQVHAIMIYEPGGYEHNLQRRLATTPEQRRDPATRQRMMQLSDVIPVTNQNRD